MIKEKIIRTVCFFTNKPTSETMNKLNKITDKLINNKFEVQTKRICTTLKNLPKLKKIVKENKEILLSAGTINFENTKEIEKLCNEKNLSFNVDLTSQEIKLNHVDLLFEIIKNKPEKTFEFAYVFNNANSTPYYPSANYSQEGFAIGLQPTNLFKGCKNLEEWFVKMKSTWQEINDLLKNEKDFLGIDSSIAPNLPKESSFIQITNKIYKSFEKSVSTDMYIKTTNFIKTQNPKPIGLCGLMLPCLEDSMLAKEYKKGNFSIERNIFLSLQSGLGIDTYPIGINEKPERVLEILKLIQLLSNKYKKPLSIRFVSDGKTKIGKKSDFKNQYLQDVIIRKL